jgi:hypothetical protein
VSVGAVESVCSGWPWWCFILRARLTDGPVDRFGKDVILTRAFRRGSWGTGCGPTVLAGSVVSEALPINHTLRLGAGGMGCSATNGGARRPAGSNQRRNSPGGPPGFIVRRHRA